MQDPDTGKDDPARSGNAPLPGRVIFETTLPPRGRIAREIERGEVLRVVDLAEIDKVRYGVDGHYGCVENLLAALAPYGIQRRDIPMSLNLFMNCPVEASGAWQIAPPVSKAGDYSDLRAEMDCLFALSNCPQDLNPCNDGRLKPLKVVIYRPNRAVGQ